MSRTRKTNERPVNPCELFLKWDSDKSLWTYWDKAAAEKAKEEGLSKEEVRSLATQEVPMSFPFVILDSLTTAKGYHEGDKASIWSNEVRSTKDTLAVFVGDKHVTTGTWNEVKGKVSGIKFCTSLYVLAKIGKELKLANLQLTGCALSPWIDFVKQSGGFSKLTGDIACRVESAEEGKKGRVTFNMPVYSVLEAKPSEETLAAADATDAILQEYLDAYFEYQKGKAEDGAEDDFPEDTTDHSVPKDDSIPNIEDVLDDDEIPF